MLGNIRGAAAGTNQPNPIDPCYNPAARAPAPGLTVSLFGAAERPDVQGGGEMDVNQDPKTTPPEPNDVAGSDSAFGRGVAFVVRHPIGIAQGVFFALVAIVILQNLESTSIDVLFWSVSTLPKLVLICLSMLIGAATWEVLRRWFWR
jgi:hypothetical protein